LVVGIIALSLFGNIPIPGGAEPAVEQAKADLGRRKGIDKE